MALEVANVFEGRDGFGAPSSKGFHNKWNEGHALRMAGRGMGGCLPKRYCFLMFDMVGTVRNIAWVCELEIFRLG